MNEKPTIDKINSFIAHIDSQYEKLNDPNYMGFTDSSMQTASPQNIKRQYETTNLPPQNYPDSIPTQANPSISSIPQRFSNQEDEINLHFDDAREVELDKNRSWCERSIEQLEMTIQLLDQCLDNDLKDLNRQQSIINLCQQRIEEAKQIYPL